MTSHERLTPGELALLEDAATDDVSFLWVLIDLGLRGNPPESPKPPSRDAVMTAFGSLETLVARGLIAVGRTEYIDQGPPGRVAPLRHVAEPLGDVLERVLAAVDGPDWEHSCWVVAT